jgi:PAS domain S-box-containing protein
MATESTRTGIEVVGEVAWGTHLCHFYETRQDLLDILIPYFRAGLEAQEFCVWVVAEFTLEEARDALRRGIPGAERHLSAGDIQIIPHAEWYLKGGTFDAERVTGDWGGKLDEALAKGYEGLRGGGVVAGLLEKYGEDVLRFEEALDEALAGRRVILLCSYLLSKVDATAVFDVVRTHEVAIVRRRGRWEVLESTELKRVKHEIEKLNAELEQWVAVRTRELEAANEELKKEVARRERVEASLRESEERFRRAFISNPTPNSILSFPDGRFLNVNDAFVRTFGYAPEEAVGKTSVELGLWPDPREQAEVGRMARDGELFRGYEVRLRAKSGRIVDVLMFTEVVELAGERCLLVMMEDITERKRAEEALRASERRFRSLIENSADAFVLFTPDGRRLYYASPSMPRVLGYSPEELAGFSAYDILHPQDVEVFTEAVAAILGRPGASVGVQLRVRHKDGAWHWFEGTYTNMIDDPNVGAIVCNFRDITERKRAEDDLRATSEQLRALSARLSSAREEEGARIAREIHDELGAALSSLRWDLEEVGEVLSEPADAARVADLRRKVAGMMSLTDTTVNTVRRIASELRPFALDDLGLTEAVEWQAGQFQARTGIVVSCDCHLENVELSREQATAVFRIFQEALTNVLRHARATRVEVALKSEAGGLVLTVGDDGRGITAEELSGSRTLGLLGMRERANLVGGELDIRGEEGGGTTVTVRIPVSG